MSTKSRTITMPRDAKTGRIVSPGYAERHPSTTTVEKRQVPAKSSGSGKR